MQEQISMMTAGDHDLTALHLTATQWESVKNWQKFLEVSIVQL
jgi:hypothetical protein